MILKSLLCGLVLYSCSSIACENCCKQCSPLDIALCKASNKSAQLQYVAVSGLTDFVEVLKASEVHRPFLSEVNMFVQLKALSIAVKKEAIDNCGNLLKRVGGAAKVFGYFNKTENDSLALDIDDCEWLRYAKVVACSSSASDMMTTMLKKTENSIRTISSSLKKLQADVDKKISGCSSLENENLNMALRIYNTVKEL